MHHYFALCNLLLLHQAGRGGRCSWFVATTDIVLNYSHLGWDEDAEESDCSVRCGGEVGWGWGWGEVTNKRPLLLLALASVWPSIECLTPRSPSTNAENRFRMCESPIRRTDDTTGPVAGSCLTSGSPAASAYQTNRKRAQRSQTRTCARK